MKFKKLVTFATVATFTTTPIITLVACKQTNYDALNNAIKKKETFVAYVGTSNCKACQNLEPVWNQWLKDDNWAKDLKPHNPNNLNIKRYKFSDEYNYQDQNAIETFRNKKWVKNIFNYVKKQQEELWENNTDIQRLSRKTYLPGDIPMLIFFKEGKYRWFTAGWGEATLGNDFIKRPEDFRQKQHFNETTLKRLVFDFILNDFRDFYEFGK